MVEGVKRSLYMARKLRVHSHTARALASCRWTVIVSKFPNDRVLVVSSQ